MTVQSTPQALVACIAALLFVQIATAAELQLRSSCSAEGAVVCLGDVTTIVGADAQEREVLAAIELFPSPAVKRSLSVREIQDALALRGVNLAKHRFSGSSQIVVHRSAEKPTAKHAGRSSNAAAKRATAAVSDAIVRYLQQTASAANTWQVALELTDDQLAAVARAEGQIKIHGGAEPWVGFQQFTVGAGPVEQPHFFQVTAQVTLPSSFVIAIRPIARSEVISAADVQLQTASELPQAAKVCQSLDEVIGLQAVTPIAAGGWIETSALRPPLLVRRGDVVTVYSRSSGIQVTTKGKARSDASMGELVEIESLFSKDKFFARVSGSQQVEIYARATSAGATAAN